MLTKGSVCDLLIEHFDRTEEWHFLWTTRAQTAENNIGLTISYATYVMLRQILYTGWSKKTTTTHSIFSLKWVSYNVYPQFSGDIEYRPGHFCSCPQICNETADKNCWGLFWDKISGSDARTIHQTSTGASTKQKDYSASHSKVWELGVWGARIKAAVVGHCQLELPTRLRPCEQRLQESPRKSTRRSHKKRGFRKLLLYESYTNTL